SNTNKAHILSQLGSQLTLPDAKEITRTRFTLAQAGYFDASAVQSFLAARVLCLFVPQILFFIFWNYLSQTLGLKPVVFMAIGTAIIGLIVPTAFVRFRINKRTDNCRRGFPDMMDLMVACVEAGLGLDATFMRVSHELGTRYPALKVNLDLMNLELRAGRSRHEAMMNFANRISLEEAKALAVMLKQAEDMGSSVGEALRTFSDDMRHKRMMRAEEKAMALSAKLTIPLILFIFPTIMTMLLLPAGIRIAAGFSGGF
ncbi:MAG: type II secretion system F family protein, partial [Litorimonas sp.]